MSSFPAGRPDRGPLASPEFSLSDLNCRRDAARRRTNDNSPPGPHCLSALSKRLSPTNPRLNTRLPSIGVARSVWHCPRVRAPMCWPLWRNPVSCSGFASIHKACENLRRAAGATPHRPRGSAGVSHAGSAGMLRRTTGWPDDSAPPRAERDPGALLNAARCGTAPVRGVLCPPHPTLVALGSNRTARLRLILSW
jgi:hypothetical protein